MTTVRRSRRAVDGVLVLDKPFGISSNAALQQAKRLLNAEKAGHTGTLDPLATGVLPLCFGAATKLAQVSLDADKRYRATLALGVTTATGDAEGEVLMVRPVDVDRAAIESACASFVGEIEQIAPMHSALKHEGKPLYTYARAGIEVDRLPRRVRIHSLAVVEGSGSQWVLDVSCSKGTYVRTLAEQIGESLGCGAHLSGLCRTASGSISLTQAVSLELLEGTAEAGRAALLLPVDALVSSWPAVALSAADAGLFLSGMRRPIDRANAAEVRVYGPDLGAFLGIAHITGGELIATRLLSPLEVERHRAPTRSSLEPAGLTL